MKQSFGGVLINAEGKVLLREPAGHYNGCVWTFAKGKPEVGESAKETALREVFEETGVAGKILAKIPGRFVGSRTSNEFFLMIPVRETGEFDWETLSVRWVTREEAREMIALTARPKRRARDLRVLEAAFALYERIAAPGPQSPSEPAADSDTLGQPWRWR